jgi:hypothetical protein
VYRAIRRAMKEEARLELQMILNKIIVAPRAIYGSETRFVRKNHETRIQGAEIKFLHGVAGYMHKDHQHNINIRKKLKFLA